MKQHELKILPQYFQRVWDGTKTFELRKDDRDYQRGDILVLREWDGEKYTGSALCVKVTYILQDAEKYGLQDGYVIMGIRHIESVSDLKPPTNYLRIVSMSPEELAEWINRYSSEAAWCKVPPYECPPHRDCERCVLDWLNEEAPHEP